METARAMTWTESSLTTACGAIHYVRQGTGPTVLLLHGLGTSLRSFSGILERLPDRFHAVAIDLLGHGRSDLSAPDLSVTAQAESVLQLIQELQIHDAALVGHSLGGSVALQVATMARERIRKVVLLASGSYAYRLPWAWRLLLGAIPSGILGLFPATRVWALRRATRRLYSQAKNRKRFIETTSALSRAGWGGLSRAFRQNLRDSELSRLETIVESQLTQPTLVLWGSDDRIAPVGPARLLFREKRNARFIELAGGSHMLHEEHPDLVGDLILEFLE
jgi:pimeloyl-ACP methyl ester carboxylesterase